MSIQGDPLAACLREAMRAPAPPGRMPMLLSFGFALLLCGCGSQNIRSHAGPFGRAGPEQAAVAEPRNHAASEPAFFVARAQAQPQRGDDQVRAYDFAGMAANVDSDLHFALLPENRWAPYRAGLSGGPDAVHLMQTRLGGSLQNVDFGAQSAGGLKPRAWSMGLSGVKLFNDHDRVTLVTYLPLKDNRIVQKVVGKVFPTEEFGPVASDLQALYLIARKRINTEFSYSAQINKFSRFDASAIYRLNARTDTGRSDLLVGLYYKAGF